MCSTMSTSDWKRGRAGRGGAGDDPDILRPDAGDDFASGERPGLGAVDEFDLDDAFAGLLENEGVAGLAQFSVDEIHRGTAEEPGDEEIARLAIKAEGRIASAG